MSTGQPLGPAALTTHNTYCGLHMMGMIGLHRQEHTIRSSVGNSLSSKEGGAGNTETVAGLSECGDSPPSCT